MDRADSLASGFPLTDPRAGAPTGAPVPPAFPAWPLLLLALPAFVAIWSGWIGLGMLCGFGRMAPLPGIADGWHINTAITLPIGMETYAAYAIRAWLSPAVPDRARTFARWSAVISLVVGATGQVAYHLMAAAHTTRAPWPVTVLVSCVPVAVLGMGVSLAHLIRHGRSFQEELDGPLPEAPVSPAVPRRSSRELVAEDDLLRVQRPELKAEQRAELLGVTARYIRKLRQQEDR